MATRFYSSVEYGRKFASTDPDVLYYNASIINNNTQDVGFDYDDPQVVFNEVRQFPLLQDTSDYMMSVVRFSFNGATKNLPLWIPRIQTGATQMNPNLTIYGLKMSAVIDGTLFEISADKFLQWIPENDVSQPPQPPFLQQNLTTNYYWGYTYSNFADMLNIAMREAVDDLVSQVQLVNPAYTRRTNYPFCYWDADTKRFSIRLDTRYWGGAMAQSPAPPAVGGERWNLWFNTNLESMLTNFKGLFIESSKPVYASGRNQIRVGTNSPTEPPNYPNQWPIYIETDLSTGYPYASPATGHTYWVVTQDYPSVTGSWSPVDAICITSSLLPVIPEQQGQPTYLGGDSTGWSSQTQQSAFQPIVADISVNQEKGADAVRGFVEFLPTAEYKMIALSNSNQPLQNIDFQVWWRNRLDNNLYPLRLYNGTSVSIKVMFRRKQLGV